MLWYLWYSRSKMHVRNKWDRSKQSPGETEEVLSSLSLSLLTWPSLLHLPCPPPSSFPLSILYCIPTLGLPSFYFTLYICFILSSCQPLFYCFFVCVAKYGFWIYLCSGLATWRERGDIFISSLEENKPKNEPVFFLPTFPVFLY